MTLSDHQQRVLDAFVKKDTDIPIGNIYMKVYGHAEWSKAGTVRRMQQKLGPTFKEINKKLFKEKGTYLLIEPGNTKRTYRLSTIKG